MQCLKTSKLRLPLVTFYFIMINIIRYDLPMLLTETYRHQLNGPVKEPNTSIYFFRPSLDGVLFLMFCLLVEGSIRF